MKKPNNLDEPKQPLRSGLGTCTGSFIQDEEAPNSFTNDNQTKVASAHRGKHNESGQLSLDELQPQREGRSAYIGQSALRRGMSPPANIKELSSGSQSSENIVDHHTPHSDATQNKLNESRY